MSGLPNIVYVMSDDQGAWAMGCAGNAEIITPNIDAIAANGIRFENFFCASPVCSPARASALTGLMPSAHGVHDWLCGGNYAPSQHPQLSGNHETVARQYLAHTTAYTDVLASAGYACALAGKWHMGDSFTPQHGFTRWFTIPTGGCPYYGYPVIRDGKVEFEDRYISDVITDEAIKSLDALAADAANPFYLHVTYTAPHSPWDAANHPDEYLELYKDCEFNSCPYPPMHENQVRTAPLGNTKEKRAEYLRGYYAAITSMDAGIGRILKRLDELGLRDNTIIIFNGDNGMNMGHHGIWGKGNGTFPQNMYDTSVKVPFIFSYPAKAPAGVVSESMCSHYDIFATLVDYLGIEAQLPALSPGKSFAGILRGEDGQEDGAVVAFDEYGPVRMIRTRAEKLIIRYPYGPNEYYDLSADPDETQNLIDSEQHAASIAALRQRLGEFFVKYADPRLDGSREAVYGVGQKGFAGTFGDGSPAFIEEVRRTGDVK